MLKILKLYAVYNRDTDKTVIDLLSGFSEEEMKKELNIFCKTIFNLFTHIVRSGWYYQAAIKRISNGRYLNDIGTRETVIPRIESSFAGAAEVLRERDEAFVRFAETVKEKDLDLFMDDFKLYDGRSATVSLWEVITQHITHQTHHRGQLSQVLDELGIVHDIGNVWPYVGTSK